ncbi:MAG: dihydropteroate synthase [Eubacteriales bacterium]|nr:dihydropteroate synthase [Eubacteriales bacterium]
MIIGNKEFDLDNKFYIMGILNVTPDSFSDGGKFNDMDHALKQTEKMIADGADLIDVGGESTRPNHIKISVEEEIERVCPIIEAIKKRFDIPISLDTYKSEVAKAGIASGADLLNDIWGLKWDGTMAKVVADTGVACCLMHNRKEPVYHDFVKDMVMDLQESVEIALAAGIQKDRIILDPGIGFAKDLEQNLLAMKHLQDIQQLGYPVLLATSRKSMIGLTLDLPVTEREEGTMATSVLGRMAGCCMFRVHDVQSNLRALRMTEAILKA